MRFWGGKWRIKMEAKQRAIESVTSPFRLHSGVRQSGRPSARLVSARQKPYPSGFVVFGGLVGGWEIEFHGDALARDGWGTRVWIEMCAGESMRLLGERVVTPPTLATMRLSRTWGTQLKAERRVRKVQPQSTLRRGSPPILSILHSD